MRKAFQIIGLGIGFLFLLLGGENATAQPPPADDYWVYFTSQGADGDLTTTHLYRMRPDGSGLESLTQTGDGFSQVQYAFWSPDREWIYFTDHGFNTDMTNMPYLYRVRYDGADLRRVSMWDYQDAFLWSPDSQWIVQTRNGLYVNLMRPDGTEQQSLKQNQSYAVQFLAWMPDSTGVIYCEYAAIDGYEPCDEVIFNVNDGSRVPLFDNTLTQFDAWSPDREWMYYRADYEVDAGYDLFRVRADGSETQRLTNGHLDYSILEWSPSGEWFLAHTPYVNHQHYTLVLMRADGSVRRILSSYVGISSFSLDGQWVSYSLYGSGQQWWVSVGPDNTASVSFDDVYNGMSLFANTPDPSVFLAVDFTTDPTKPSFALLTTDGQVVGTVAFENFPLGGNRHVWSPDGVWLYFTSTTEYDQDDVYRLTLAGDLERLTSFEGRNWLVGLHS